MGDFEIFLVIFSNSEAFASELREKKFPRYCMYSDMFIMLHFFTIQQYITRSERVKHYSYILKLLNHVYSFHIFHNSETYASKTNEFMFLNIEDIDKSTYVILYSWSIMLTVILEFSFDRWLNPTTYYI